MSLISLTLLNVVLVIVSIFFLLLLVKNIFKLDFCVICSAFTLTWISLIILGYFGYFQDRVLIALLMGHTSLGLFYLFEEKAKRDVKILRLPVLLTLMMSAYAVVFDFNVDFSAYILLLVLWILFGFVYVFKNNSKIRVFANKLIECCRG